VLGLIRKGEGVAAQVLIRLGADLARVRRQVTLFAQGIQDDNRDRPPGPAPDPDDADLHSVHYRLRRPSPAASMFNNPAPTADAGDPVLPAILGRLDSIDNRLAAIEQHLSVPGG